MTFTTEILNGLNKYWSAPAIRSLPRTLPDYRMLTPGEYSNYGVHKVLVEPTSDGNGSEQLICAIVDWDNDFGWYATVRIWSRKKHTRTAADYDYEDLCLVRRTEPHNDDDYTETLRRDDEEKQALYNELCKAWGQARNNIR